MDYECSLLDGTRCYSSKELGPKELILGKSEIEAGLNEGLRLLKPGAEAIFIIPPFLAFGLIGDGKLIPPRAVMVYNVKVMNEIIISGQSQPPINYDQNLNSESKIYIFGTIFELFGIFNNSKIQINDYKEFQNRSSITVIIIDVVVDPCNPSENRETGKGRDSVLP